MRTRYLPIFFGVVFALTWFFAVAAGAQEERTDTEGVGVQVVEVRQQRVPNDQQQQQQVVEVQQQQVQSGQQIEAQDVQIQAQGDSDNKFDLKIKKGSTTVESASTKHNVKNQSFTVERSGNFELETTVNDVKKYTVTIDDCRSDSGNCSNPREILTVGPTSEDRTESFTIDGNKFRVTYSVTFKDNNNGGRSGGGGGGGGGGGDNQDDITQENTTPDTTTTDTNTANANTANAALDNTTADDANLNADFANRPDSGSFRCDLFLRTVRDDQGALRAQYQGDEEIVQRFEQCLSEDVLADTIPDRNLPFTGGPLLPFGGGLVLFLVAAAVLAGRIIRR